MFVERSNSLPATITAALCCPIRIKLFNICTLAPRVQGNQSIQIFYNLHNPRHSVNPYSSIRPLIRGGESAAYPERLVSYGSGAKQWWFHACAAGKVTGMISAEILQILVFRPN
ncbi:hypothetical protein O5541_09010 [Escherichia coli]|nr:hypothetical protein [Escherichia coli]